MAANRTRARAIAILLLLLAALVFWLTVWLRSVAPTSPPTSRLPGDTAAAPALAGPLSAPPDDERSARDETSVRRAAAERAPLTNDVDAAPLAFEPTLAVLVRFLDSDGRPTAPEKLRLSFSAPGRATRVEVSEGETALLVRNLTPELYTLTPFAAPYHACALPLDLRAAPTRASATEFEPTQDVGLVLWDAQDVLVLVTSRDGRPFDELVPPELPGRSTFVRRLELQVSREPRAANQALEGSSDSSAARIVRPSSLITWDSGAAIAALELAREPPLWVALGFAGVALGWQRLERGQHELRFQLDGATVKSLLARLALAVRDESGGARADVTIELRAEPHSGAAMFLTGARTDGFGRAEFPQLLPGRYVIALSDGEARHQEPLELGAGADRQLELVLPRDRAPVELRVVDRDGQPADAWIQVGSFEPGAWHDRSYPALLHERTEGGAFRLPLPSSLSIVRARKSGPGNNAQTLRSRPLLLDPAAPPKGVVTLVVEPLTQVEIAPVTATGALILHDELGLLVFEQDLEAQRSPRLELLRGRYTLQWWPRGASEPLHSEFEVHAEASVVALP